MPLRTSGNWGTICPLLIAVDLMPMGQQRPSKVGTQTLSLTLAKCVCWLNGSTTRVD
jgi:hypothetical protein